jgi:hypothetical protein
MTSASERTIQVLEHIVNSVPVGTNLALLQLMWAILSGAFLKSRGAVFPALQVVGFGPDQIRRSWQALRYGVWNIYELLQRWRGLVDQEQQWQARTYEGYQPLAADITPFWRPRLQGWAGKFFHRLANRAVAGVGFGLVAQVGQVNGHRIPMLQHIIGAGRDKMSEQELKLDVLRYVSGHLGDSEVFIHDAGVTLAEVQSAAIARFVIRLAKNCTARRNALSPQGQKGRPPEYGSLLRPLPRSWKNRSIAATEADWQTCFQFPGRTIAVQGWQAVVRADQKVDANHETFTILVFFDPLYVDPLVLGTNLSARPETIFRLFLDRWPVEQIPLAAKQMLGLARQFVFAPTSCQRLPELALLMGNILTYLAAVSPPVPTGFWDRRPKKRPGASVAYWRRLIFHKITRLVGDFGKSSRPLLIYRRASGLIGGLKRRAKQLPPDFRLLQPTLLRFTIPEFVSGLYYLPDLGT